MTDLVRDILIDLLRSCWIVERARGSVYRTWGAVEGSFLTAAKRADQRADIVGRALTQAEGRFDEALVEPHAEWIKGVIGSSPGEVALGDFFLTRLGDWTEAHAGGFLDDLPRFAGLGKEDKDALSFPEEFPGPPPIERVDAPLLDPHGEILFTFGILADLHVGSKRGNALVSAAVDDLNSSGAELVIQLGDLTDRGNPGQFERAAKLLARLQMPVTAMMGNHDVYGFELERLSGRELFSKSFGREPEGALSEHKGIRFAVLDSAEHAISPFPSFDLLSGVFLDEPGGALVRGSLTAKQHDILAEVAEPGSGPAFIFLHHPPQPFVSFPPVLFGLRDVDSGRLHATVDSGNVWGVFAGHTHRNARTTTYSNDVPAHEVGTARDYPFGYALVDVTDAGYRFRFVQIKDEDLLEAGYARTGEIQRRYSRGSDSALSFVWAKPNQP